MSRMAVIAAFSLILMAGSSALAAQYDVIIRNGVIYDGSGRPPVKGGVAIQGDTIALVGDLGDARATIDIDAGGKAIAPGFINMLSWANTSLIIDGRSQSDIRQGVTLEVMGEGTSMGPRNAKMKQRSRNDADDHDGDWTTLGEYLTWLEKRGVSCNVASFVGATTVRIHEIGYEDRPPSPEELERMKALVRQAMEEGAVGVSTSLIYTPAFFASTEEIIELAKVAAEYDGLYISHIRNEGDKLLEAIDEFLRIARQAKIRAEIYHLKQSGRKNWHKIDAVFEKIEAAQREALQITADIYPYSASSTGLSAILPPWVKEGGTEAFMRRLKDPEIRKRVIQEVRFPSGEWDAGLETAGSAENVLLVGFRNPKLRPLTGKTLAEVAQMRGTSPEDTAIDLLIEDNGSVDAVYFTMSEDNIRREMQKPWISFCSDARSLAPEGVFLNRSTHPRAYGAFARVLAKYVRDEKLIPLEEAIRRLTSFPASNLRIERRGSLKPGYFADVVVFDPDTIQDHATFKEPHQYATGVQHVFVNGVQVLKDGEHTGAKPGRFVKGPGARKKAQASGRE